MVSHTTARHAAHAPFLDLASVPFVSDDGRRYDICLADRHDAEVLEFVRTRLTKEASIVCADLMRKLQHDGDSELLLATCRPASDCVTSVSTRDCDAAEAVKAGMLLLDTSMLQSLRVVGIAWLSVRMCYRGERLGRRLVQLAEQYCRARCATAIEAPISFTTELFARMHYLRGRSTGLYDIVVFRKLLHDVAANADGRADGDLRRCMVDTRADASQHDGDVSQPATWAQAATQVNEACPAESSTAMTARTTTRTATRAPAARPRRRRPAARQRKRASTPRDARDELPEQPVTRRTRCSEYTGHWLSYDVPDVPAECADKTFLFRVARVEDRKAWCGVLLAASHYNIGGMDLINTSWAAPCRIVAVRRADAQLVGLVAARRDGWIELLACTPEQQGRGFGSFLLFLALEWLRVRGVRRAALAPLNRAVMAFYAKWAFTVRPPARHGHKRVRLEDAVMERAIDPDVYLLHNGRALSTYVEGYDASGETAGARSAWYYYFYSVPATRPPGAVAAAAHAAASKRVAEHRLNSDSSEFYIGAASTTTAAAGGSTAAAGSSGPATP